MCIVTVGHAAWTPAGCAAHGARPDAASRVAPDPDSGRVQGVSRAARPPSPSHRLGLSAQPARAVPTPCAEFAGKGRGRDRVPGRGPSAGAGTKCRGGDGLPLGRGGGGAPLVVMALFCHCLAGWAAAGERGGGAGGVQVAPLEAPWGGFWLSGAGRELGREGFRACRLPKTVTAAAAAA